MRFAVISDIHGNLVALDAVLEDLGGDCFDELICLGDVAANGPRPVECLRRLQALGCPVVIGNTDARIAGIEHPYIAPRDGDHPMVAISWWCATQLSDADRAFIARFETTISRTFGNSSKILFFHASPRHYTDYIVSTTSDDELAAMIDDTTAEVLVGGHTHLQMLRRKGGRTVVNAGAVGRALLRDPLDALDSFIVAPWAEYAVIEIGERTLRVDLRRVRIDLDALERDVRASQMPEADWWLGEINPSGEIRQHTTSSN